MTAFTADWLRLREPSDHAARDAAAAAACEAGHRWHAALRGAASPSAPKHAMPVMRVMDLGCGTGATLRYLAPRLGGAQHWHVCDHDEALLQAWPGTMAAWARSEGHRVDADGDTLRIGGQGFTATVERHRLDLAHLTHALDALPLAETDLVCATALIDLVSRTWLADLIDHARRAAARLSLALVADGHIDWDPTLAGDAEVARTFARHQGRDKGFGPALGADAPAAACELLARAGYVVESTRSDWVLQGGPLQAALIDGMAAAVLEQDPDAAPLAATWRRLRVAALEGSRLRVGHVDIVAVPPCSR
jgi:SAM-dependent methyltransferase